MDYKTLEVDFFIKNYQMIDRLGAGAFGETYLCLNKLDEKQYAVKVILCTEKNTENVLRECKAMANFKHENIVHYHTAWMEAGFPGFAQRFVDDILCPNPEKDERPTRTVYIVMQYYPRVLENEIKKNTLTEEDVQKIFYGLAKGLAAIHDSGWVHCDVHPGNIFLDESGAPKISDFGLSRKIGEGVEGLRFGKELYQPTEIFAQERHTPGADMFSFALCMIEVTCSLKSADKAMVFGEATAGFLPPKLTNRNDLIHVAVHQILTAATPSERMKACEIGKKFERNQQTGG